MNHAPRSHWLRGNKGEQTPRRLLVLDAESTQETADNRELHQLRCWVLRQVIRPKAPGGAIECAQFEGETRAGLLAQVEQATKKAGSWRLFSHNLSYDLGLTKLPLDLLQNGWELGQHNLASNGPWAHLAKKSRGLWLCDSWSWLPRPLEELGQLVGLQKPPLPQATDDPETWLRRCRADVEILTACLLQLMEEWDARALGWWSVTGPASGWNTFLHFPARGKSTQERTNVTRDPDPHHKATKGKVLIVPDLDARQFERQALYSGRRDTWRTGQLKGGPWAEIDLKNAHLTICAHMPLPYRRWAAFDHLELDDWRLANPAAGLVAEALVRTRTPRYPLRLAGAVLHPVGEFATVLAGPEITEARKRGDLLRIGRGYGYHLGTQMQGWAQWCLAILNTEPEPAAAMLPVAVKAWGRNVPGRWGMLHAKEIKSGPSHVREWALEPITIGNPPRRGSIFHLAGRWTESIMDEEADDSFPAVLAYIQSYCRLALNAMLDAIPEQYLVSCNTEGAWINDYAPVSPELLSQRTAPLTVRVKQVAHQLKVLSPQHHLTETARQYSGIPRAAADLGGERFQFLTWPKLKGQIERGDPRGYIREVRTVNLSGLPVSRWSFEDGACEPIAVRWGPESGNELQPPSPDLERRHGPLRAVQHPALKRALSSI